MISRAYRAKP